MCWLLWLALAENQAVMFLISFTFPRETIEHFHAYVFYIITDYALFKESEYP